MLKRIWDKFLKGAEIFCILVGVFGIFGAFMIPVFEHMNADKEKIESIQGMWILRFRVDDLSYFLYTHDGKEEIIALVNSYPVVDSIKGYSRARFSPTRIIELERCYASRNNSYEYLFKAQDCERITEPTTEEFASALRSLLNIRARIEKMERKTAGLGNFQDPAFFIKKSPYPGLFTIFNDYTEALPDDGVPAAASALKSISQTPLTHASCFAPSVASSLSYAMI